ncbi:MAG: IPT/TIG domain-containing protein, partial [Holophagae bacterium]
MKSFLNCLIICGLVVAVGCSGNSPKPPSVTPPNGGNGDGVYQITSLSASDDNPYVNTAVLVTATVTLDGEAVPDGTNVEFIANGGVFPANGGTDLTVATTGGTASVQFGATETGVYTIQARVKAVTAQIQVAYRNPDQSDALQIYNLNPASGSYFGGETVVITGKGIRAPAEVYFTVQGLIYQAIVDQVVPSVPASGSGTITIRTPEPTAADSTQTSAADVRVIVDVGATTQEEVTVPSGFVFIGNVEPPPNVPPTPVLFGVDPYYGRSQGGETVTILGMNFQWEPPTGGTEPTFAEVYFTFNGQDLLAQVERVAANQIEVITPRFSFTPLNDDTSAGVKLTRSSGSPVEKGDVFIVKSDIAQPEITGISPTAGPLDGGTIVTINGHGFQLPIQVAFGQLEATDVQLYDDQSLADNDVITCRTPDYSQQGQTPPLSVNVRVTNLQNGLSDTSDQVFTYGEILYITQANPTQGQIGDLLALYGAGFEDPLTVWFSGSI